MLVNAEGVSGWAGLLTLRTLEPLGLQMFGLYTPHN